MFPGVASVQKELTKTSRCCIVRGLDVHPQGLVSQSSAGEAADATTCEGDDNTRVLRLVPVVTTSLITVAVEKPRTRYGLHTTLTA